MSALATDLARGLDPVALAREIGMEPDPWQVDVLRSEADRILLNTSRQTGKSTVMALLAVHTAVYVPRSVTLVISASERQGAELFRVAAAAYRTLGRPVPSESENTLSLSLENGSRIIVLPSVTGTVRGYVVDLLLIDEAARVDDLTYLSLRPMLAVSRGRIVLASTPFGRRGFFFESWRSDERWERYEVPATECPRITPEFLVEEERTLGAFFYSQEYCCTFGDLQSQAFRESDIEAMFDTEVEPWTV